MRNLSSAFKEQLNKDNRNYLEWADITLADGTKLSLTNKHIWNNGLKVEDSVSDSSEFQIGASIINKATLTINNMYDDFSEYAFEGAEVVLYAGLQIGDNPERIRLFTGHVVDAPVTNSSIISLPCYDNMHSFDKDYSESKLTYPASRSQIIRDACDVCGVNLQTTTFANDDYVIQERPADEQLTFRQVISWVAQLGGQWCKCDSYGRLCVDWYDLTNYEAETTDESKFHTFSSNVETTVNSEDVVITGIRVKEYVESETEDNKPETYLYGKEGYVISISGNRLIPKGSGEAVSAMIGKRVVGMRFRPFSISTMNTPAVEAGDLCFLIDRKENRYKSFVTSTTFQVGNNQIVTCDAKSAARNSAKQYSIQSQTDIAYRREFKKERTEREKALEDLAKRIAQSPGVYTTVETSSGGGKIYYLHNKPNLEESDIVWKMTAEAWGVSTDGGRTWNGGMTVDGDTIARILTATGVNADWIKTGQFSVTDSDGNEVFFVDCDTGIVRIKAQSFSLTTGKTIEQIAQEEAKKEAEKAAQAEVKNFADTVYKSDQESVQKQIDGKVETWLQPTDPSVNWGETSETEWSDIDGSPIKDVSGNSILLTVESGKALHEGDLWKNSDTNVEYRYQDGQWVEMKVPDEVFDQIDGKAQIFVETPYTPYRVGDLWFDSDTSDIMTCTTTRLTGNFVSSDWEKRNKYTDDSELNSFVTAVYDPAIAKLQAQIDGQIETWYYDYEPSLQNEPAVNWTTTEERKQHEGDLFYWKSKGYAYRFLQDGAAWKWQLLQDADITKALAAAEKAQDTADHKRRVFVVTPQPPYDIGDLWVQGDGGDIMRCCVARSESASFSASDWEKASKYTDDTRANEVKAELDVLGADLQNQIDGKIETYNQAEDPSGAWTTDELKAQHKGDLWYSPKEEITRRWNGTSWEKLSDADAKAANNLAMTKKRVFSVTPYPPYDVDDLWVQGENGDLMRCVNARQTGNYDSTDWVRATKYTDDTAIKNFINNTYASDLDSIKNQLDQKVETWYQESDPSVNWRGTETWPWSDINGNSILDVSGNEIQTTVETEKALHEGDLWHCTKDNSEYIYSSGEWHDKSIPDEVFDKIDGKSSIYAAQPNPPYEQNDLWFTGTEILVCIKTRESGSFNSSDWVKKDTYTDDSAVDDFIKNVYDPKIDSIQTQIDGKIETWFYDYEPTLSNIPAKDWTTDDLKSQHNGDLFFWQSKGYTYRFLKIDGAWKWQLIQDEDINNAMKAASKAQDTADGKRRVFTTTPTPPYDVGDLWTQGSTGDLMRCSTARASGSYNASDWVLATKYTDDTVANKAIAQIEVLDGKINLKVTADDVASIIEQKADSIRLKANKISWKSTYSSMTENGVLTCQGANINGTVNTVSSNRKAEMSGGYTRYYWDDKLLGHIGTNCTKSNNNVQGLVFDLDYDGWYMSWSYKESPNADAYSMKLTYASGAFDNFSKDTLHVGCNMDMHGWTLKNPSFEGGGVTGTLNFTQITNMKSDGNCTYANGCKMQFKNGILIAGTWSS